MIFFTVPIEASSVPSRAALWTILQEHQLPIESLKYHPPTGLFEARLRGEPLPLFITANGDYFIFGDLYQIQENIVNLSQQNRDARDYRRLQTYLTDHPEALIRFSPHNGKSHAIVYIFTDIDCAYCRRLHQKIADYHAQGIEIAYLAFPRGGPGTEAFDEYIAVWCNEDAHNAMTRAKNGQSVRFQDCVNPVKQQYELGLRLGVRGTPTIFLENGKRISGYISAQQLAVQLGIDKKM